MNKIKKCVFVSARKQVFPRFCVRFLTSVFALSAALFSLSCVTPPRSGKEAAFLFVEKNERLVHANGQNHTELSFNIVDVDVNGALRKELRNILYKGKSAESYLLQTSAVWKKEYVKAKNVSGDSAEWFFEESHSVARAGSFAVLKRNAAEFHGGARPGWREDSFVFDLSAPERRLTLDDIFTKAGLDALASLTERELRRFSVTKTGKALSSGTPLSSGIYSKDTIPPSEDFYPADNGLNFQWDDTEIAAHSEGAVEISIRWNEVSGLLNSKGKALAVAFQSAGEPR